jgi:homeobox protein cut-like
LATERRRNYPETSRKRFVSSKCVATLLTFAPQAAEIDQLKQRLKQYGDYDEIKRELEIMKVRPMLHRPSELDPTNSQYVEFAGLDEDADEDGDRDENNEPGLQLPNPNAQKANAQRGKTLEALLATKNKKILEELTKFRVNYIILLFYYPSC